MTAIAMTHPIKLVRRAKTEPLQARAERLWPDDPYLQAEWMRKVHMVRATKRGWLAERPVFRKPDAA